MPESIKIMFIRFNGKSFKPFNLDEEEIDGAFLSENTNSIVYIRPMQDIIKDQNQ